METAASKTIQIVVNGQPRTVPDGLHLSELLPLLGVDPSRVAIERNREIARKSTWDDILLQAGDQLEVVWFVGGG